MTSWASVASVAQLAASLALILRFLIVTAAYPITQTTDEETYERTTYIVPLSSTENDSDIYRGNLRGIPRDRQIDAKPSPAWRKRHGY